MPEVDDVRRERSNDCPKRLVDAHVPIAVLRARQIDQVNPDPVVVRIPLPNQLVVGAKRIFAAREDLDLVAISQCLRKRLRIYLRPGVEPHRIAVDHL